MPSPYLIALALLSGWSVAAADDHLEHCASLSKITIPAAKITLPTRGAIITSARLVAAAGDSELGEYCLVDGEIISVSETAQPIRYQVAMPSRWNERMLQIGGGGFRGVLISPVEQHSGSVLPKNTVGAGYATVGNDSGHQGSAVDASFALHEEQLANYAGEQINKTHDAASIIINQYYGQEAEYSYFMGASSGGREAVTAMRDYPSDYQGVISIWPGVGFTRLTLKAQLIYNAMTRDDGAGSIDAADARFLHQQILDACDGNDGLKDGLLSNPDACQFDFSRLRCPQGQDSECFSDAQVATLELMHSPVKLDYRFEDGLDHLPGYALGTVWTSPLLNLPGATALTGQMANFPALGMYHLLPTGLLKFMVARDPEFDVSSFNPRSPGSLKPRLLEVVTMIDRVNADIGGYIKQGGKLILVHGLADELPAAQDTVRFYQGQVQRHGEKLVSEAVAFYLVPGQAHGHGTFMATGSMPLLPALEKWVSKGIAPGTLTATDSNKESQGRTRPMCQYPNWPQYDGKGDVNSAESFSCVATQKRSGLTALLPAHR